METLERPPASCESKILESKLAELELEENRDFEEVFEMDFGLVECGTGGKAHLRAIIPLMVKFRFYNWEKLPKLKKYFVDYLFDKGIIWSKKEQETIDFAITCGMAGNGDPSMDMEDPINVMAAAYNIIVFYMDDIMDEGFMGDATLRTRTEEVITVLDDIFKNMNGDTEEETKALESCTIPALQPVIHLLSLIRDLSEIVFPISERTKDHDLLVRQHRNAVLCQYILCDPGLRASLSSKGYAFLRRYNIAVAGAFTFYTLTRKIVLRDVVRENALFRIIHDIYSNMMALINDLLGILKDINLQEKYNFVLLDMADTHVSLETAFKNRNHELIELMKDFCKLSKKLCEHYPDDENLVAYIQYTREVWTSAVLLCFGDIGEKRYHLHDKAVTTIRPLNPSGVFGI